ncbi:hypothetical protein KRR26_25405 [Corallococcus sp. M34]|uniref:hypothetical protein n=1 Tax=Citreicoccus inhibens TaxID=2849499 RepID=UPI0011C45193|nr:hypothetical protein [Citreicoccus inhibens]MBU8898954.1 hypothetical protein [Citreicoccus inhibens]
MGCGGAVTAGAGAPGDEPASEVAPLRVGEDGSPSGAVAPEVLAGEPLWLQVQRGAGKEQAAGVAYDKAGNLLVATNVSYGGLEDSSGVISEPVVSAFFITKYSRVGERQWSRRFEGKVTALSVDWDGNAVAWGTGSGAASPGLELAGYFLMKLNADGQSRWSHTIQSLAPGAFTGLRISTDRQGNVAIAGTLEGAVGQPPALASEGRVAVVMSYTPNGEPRWSRVESRPSDGTGAATDANGTVYFSGFLRVPAPGETHFVPFLQRIAPDGTLEWERQLPTRYAVTTGMALRGNRVLVTGYAMQDYTFAGKQYLPGSGHSDGFLLAYNRDGEERWSRQMGYSALDVNLTSGEGAVIIGRYENGDDLGTGPMPGAVGSQRNIFIARYDREEGGLEWVRGFSQDAMPNVDTHMDRFFVTTSLTGEVTAMGATLNAVTFGSRTLPAPLGGWRDLFIVGLSP